MSVWSGAGSVRVLAACVAVLACVTSSAHSPRATWPVSRCVRGSRIHDVDYGA